ncbi:pyridoxal phosphate-dependent aminotransferase [Candidatus Auribacterota bacterium]
MKIDLAKKVKELAPSGIRIFFDLVLGMKDVVSLGVGEPDFPTPWHIRESAIQSIEEGTTSYTSNQGYFELRRVIAKYLNQKFSLKYNPDQEILITVGVSEAMDLIMRAILNPGDKVLLVEPHYVSYPAVVDLASGIAVSLKTKKENNFKLKPQDIEKKVDKKTKAIVLNYPCNPTGTSYSKQELTALARVIKKHNLLVISDEIYDMLTYDYKHTPFPRLPGMKERTIYLNGFSKSYAMTGFRIGFACGPKSIIAGMNKIHQYTILCAPITGQIAAIEALTRGEKEALSMAKEYNRRRRFVVKRLNEIGLTCHMPEGAFYAFPSIKNTKYSSMDFSMKLLEKKKVAVVPGTAFGSTGEGFIRISYASSIEKLKEAMLRIEHFLKNS